MASRNSDEATSHGRVDLKATYEPINNGNVSYNSRNGGWPLRIISLLQRHRLACFFFLVATTVPFVQAEKANCSIFDSEEYGGNFNIHRWIRQGICIRKYRPQSQCENALVKVLRALNPLHAAQYNGAASVLALLPTIGALLGAPTTEVWKLLTLVPFGGWLAMCLSFGGAILPVHVADYEPATSSSFRLQPGQKSTDPASSDYITLLDRIYDHLYRKEGIRVSRKYVTLGLFLMVALLLGAQGAIITVEVGSVLPWWCSTQWWMHGWYALVTILSSFENWVHLPFSTYAKMYISDVPYEVTVTGGDDMTQIHKPKATASPGEGIPTEELELESIGKSLKDPKSLTAATVEVYGSLEHTAPRNSILIIVSVVRGHKLSKLRASMRLLVKSLSIAAFVAGTSFFASTQLVALPVAALALTLVLSAAVFGRAVAAYITATLGRSDPFLHIMANSESEARQVIARIMLLPRTKKLQGGGEAPERCLQIEKNGHIYIDCRRVAKRRSLWVGMMGIMAKPYDLASLVQKQRKKDGYGHGYISGQPTMISVAHSRTNSIPASSQKPMVTSGVTSPLLNEPGNEGLTQISLS